ncbi:MAG: histidine kinase [Firmicutes bacterium]|nr:histidine kinase [Bacillota bacterium]
MKFIWKKLKIHSLRQKIALMQTLFMVLPIFAGSAVLFLTLSSRNAAETQNEVQKDTAAIARNIDREMTSYASRSSMFAYNGELLELLNGADAGNIISIVKLHSLIQFYTFLQNSYTQRLSVFTFYLENTYENGGNEVAALAQFPNGGIKDRILGSEFGVIWWENSLVTDKFGNKYVCFYRNLSSATKNSCILQMTVSYETIKESFDIGTELDKNAVFYHVSSDGTLLYGRKGDGGAVSEIDPNSYVLVKSPSFPDGSYLLSGPSQAEINSRNLHTGLMLLAVFTVLIVMIFLLSKNTSTTITRGFNEFINHIAVLDEDEMKQYLSGHTFEDEISVITKKLAQMLINRDETHKRLAESDKMKSILEILLLQERINPHLLYNSLTVLRIHSVKNKDEKTTKLLDSLTAYYRSALSQGNMLESVENELHMLTEYVSVINQITGARYEVAAEVPESLYGRHILRHALQPLTENAVKHGFLGRDEGRIAIRAYQDDGMICFIFSDDGSGMSGQQIEEILSLRYTAPKGGYGLRNLIQRLKLYYGEECGIQIFSELGQGTTIRLCIPDIKS